MIISTDWILTCALYHSGFSLTFAITAIPTLRSKLSDHSRRKMTDFGDTNFAEKAGDKELQEFLMIEKQKAQFNAQIHEFNDVCWDKCVDKPSNKLDGRTETCLTNCVDRFIDVSLLITNRFAQLLQKSA